MSTTKNATSGVGSALQWKLAVEDLPQPGTAVIVEESGGLPSTAMFLRVRTKKKPAGAVELDDGSYALAYVNVCTHMGCRLIPGKEGKLNEGGGLEEEEAVVGPCKCHGTRFDLLRGGVVVLGPATEHLPVLTLKLKSSELEASVKDTGQDPNLENWPNS